jgi:hypothetical protein
LPDSVPWLDEWQPFAAELWVGSTAGQPLDIAAATAQLRYETERHSAISVEFGPAFSENQSAVIQDDDGAISLTATVADLAATDGPVLFARVQFGITDDDDGVPHVADGHYLAPLPDVGVRVEDATVELPGIGITKAEYTDPNWTKLWAVMFDVDDNNSIDFGDLSYLAAAFNKDVHDPANTFGYAVDWDRDGVPTFGEVSFLAANFQKSASDGGHLVYPKNFPADWDVQLTAAMAAAPAGAVETLTQEELTPVVDEAIRRWTLAEGTGVVEELREVTFSVVDLPAETLGQRVGSTSVVIDVNAGGIGWYVDGTLVDDTEYQRVGLHESFATPDSPAQGRIDLLTAVMHELGHVMELDHTDEGLMAETLPAGIRRSIGDPMLDEAPFGLGLGWSDGQLVDDVFADGLTI